MKHLTSQDIKQLFHGITETRKIMNTVTDIGNRLNMLSEGTGFIRKTRPDPPKHLDNNHYRRLKGADLIAVSEFLKDNYGDSDWYLDADSWLSNYLDDANVIALGLFDEDDSLRATVFSVPLTDGYTFIMKLPYKTVRVIEGLCVHRNDRKKGLAGYMISAIDYESSVTPTILLYSRELPAVPLISTHLNVKTYGYIECSKARTKTIVEPMNISDFKHLWYANSQKWSEKDIIASPQSRRGGIQIWVTNNSVIVVCDTKRVSKKDNSKIWEVVWCGSLDGGLFPGPLPLSYLESVASKYRGLLFITTSQTVEKTEIAPWKIGRSGVHAWYIYNFVTSSFGSCEIHSVREEL